MGPLEQDTQSDRPYNGAALRSLRERLQNATGPDEEIDVAFVALLNHASYKRYPPTDDFGPKDRWQFWSRDGAHFLGSEHRFKVQPIASSVDAALAFAGRVLPGWEWSVSKMPSGRFYALLTDPADRMNPLGPTDAANPDGEASTAPLAVLIALINALLSETDEPSQQQASVEPETGS